MATAPTPQREGAREEADDRRAAAAQVFRIRTDGGGLDFTIAAHNLPIRLRREFRSQTGQSVRDLTGGSGSFDLDSIVLFWWASRRMNGEDVTYPDVEAEWDDRFGHVTYGDLIIEFADGDDPEDSGQTSS